MRRLASELGIDGRLEFAGSQPPARVADYMRESALLVLPSRRESFGAVLVEALACGIPVVATRCGGPEDFITDAVGVLVEKENPEALAAAIRAVLSRLDEYPAAALSRYAHAGYAWEGIADRTWQVYAQTLGAAQA